MEILFLEPVYKDYIWGGQRLKKEFNKETPYDNTAESWEISTNEHGKSKIKNGKFKDRYLSEIFNMIDMREDIFGTKCLNLDKFPLLIKFIDAKKDLSVQVHPDDEYARKYENDSGKVEIWYILDCKPNAKIIYGLKPQVNKSTFEKALRTGNVEKYLNYIDIKKGDVIYVPSGTIHAILADTLICEIQQNSDLTYRVYDWNRVDKNGQPRELNIKKAIDVIKLNTEIKKVESDNEDCQELLNSKYFNVEKIEANGIYTKKSDKKSFNAVNVIAGNGIIHTSDEEYMIKKGDSFIIPSAIGQYTIIGKVKLLYSYI